MPGSTKFDHPCILACGYRQVCVTKNNNYFPAWLVLVPSLDNEKNGEQNTSQQSAAAQDTTTWSCQWRSKKDFLLLSRVLAKGNHHNNCKCQAQSKLRTFPKAPFQKLSDKAPWHRPFDESFQSDLPVTLDVLNEINESNEPNGFLPNMKKNLSQMDQFLLGFYRHAFFRDSAGELDLDAIKSLKDAWRIFSRPSDSEEIVTNSNAFSRAARMDDTQELPTPQSLGQYFCTPENAKQVWILCLNSFSAVLVVVILTTFCVCCSLCSSCWTN